VRGLAVIITATAAALGCISAADGAVKPHSGQPRDHVKVRTLRHERYIRKIAIPGKSPARRGTKPRVSKARVSKTAPSRIDIPAIGVAASVLTLRGSAVKDTAGVSQLPVPPLTDAAEAGWYQFTSTPGTKGNTVIVGHVDTYVGPGVFYSLYLLRPGNAIYVDTGSTRQRFRVTSVREVHKSGFPVNQVFGATNKHRLWLITCGGPFDYQTRHYLDNIIVSATWQPARRNHPRKSVNGGN
jgi:LPXTG-site transpeptidase (sortase) family protein